MIEKDFASKLAAGMRRAKQPSTTEATVPAAAMTPGAAATTQATSAPQAGRSASANREGPWKDLHPARIWPD